MRTATGLTLIALGAILAFAVHGHPHWLNIQVIGWVLMLTGVAGMFIPRRGYGWLRRRMVLRRGPRGPVVSRVDETQYPPYVLSPGPSSSGSEETDAGRAASIGRATAQWEAAERAAAPGEPRPAEEVVEEYIEE